jgi:hypothetical protein
LLAMVAGLVLGQCVNRQNRRTLLKSEGRSSSRPA